MTASGVLAGSRRLKAGPVLLALALLLGCASAGVQRGSRAARAGDRPNIILIVTDDQRPESIEDMPNLRRQLVEQGITFDRAFATTPICCPARASILRGQYAHNHRTLTASGFSGTFYRFFTERSDESTIATWLDSAGYRTFFTGKYLNGYVLPVAVLATHARDPRGAVSRRPYVPPGWDEWQAVLSPMGYFDYAINHNGRVVKYGSEPEDYLTDVLADRSVEFIRSMAARDDPFFMYVAPFAPHGERLGQLPVPAPRHAGAFADRRADRRPSFNEADVKDKLGWGGILPALDAAQIAEIDETHRRRLQTLLAVDEMVGRLFDALRETGEAADTIVIYTSDNGYRLGEHRTTGKNQPWEEDIGVPLVIAGPGVAPGRRDELVLLSDLAPTIAALARVRTPRFVDGRSLVPLLGAEGTAAETWRRAIALESWHPTTSTDEVYWRGVRTAGHKYFRPYRPGLGVWGPCHLYDLAADPFELENFCRAAEPALRAQLRDWAEALASCAGEGCRDLESQPPAPRRRKPAE